MAKNIKVEKKELKKKEETKYNMDTKVSGKDALKEKKKNK